MREYSLSDLNRRPGEIADRALVEPVMLRKHGRPQVVMMSAEHYARLVGAPVQATPERRPVTVNPWSSMRSRGPVAEDDGGF